MLVLPEEVTMNKIDFACVSSKYPFGTYIEYCVGS